ncbi:hypothetical protein HAHE_35860 [Haloferula helveola]|uniref:Uncharacterized protein n=2 Tax=Haloferula helveola TaxID=490095 RepID=A0ABN6H934_9BACT|nr:hypothetical protein HAHE_35860 [Haloferula helveola]
MDTLWMILAFALAAYAIVANDSIQTLGTFLSSNAKRPWWILWIWISGIMIVTVTWGWMINAGDPAFGRLNSPGKEVPFPHSYGGYFTWLFVLPPLALVLLTRAGIPVSTSLLVLTAFKGLVAAQQGKSAQGAIDLFGSMMQKSLVGYAIAFVLGLVIFFLVTGALERRFYNEPDEVKDKPHPGWMVFQWLSTGFLWSMWLVQDLANIFAYLPRELHVGGLVLSLGGMVALQGYLIRQKGGKIQAVVTSKTNTLDVRSATFIDLLYGVVLLMFKVDYIPALFEKMGMDVPWPPKMPMSTTWVFLGLLAGREIGLAMKLRHRGKPVVARIVFMDAGKAFLGSVVAIVLALALPIFVTKVVADEPAADAPAETATEQESDSPDEDS